VSGRVQIVLSANPVDNVRACLLALMTHPHVHWVGKGLAVTALQVVQHRIRVGPCERVDPKLRQFRKTEDVGHGMWAYWYDIGGDRAVREFNMQWTEYRKRPVETLIVKYRPDKSNFTLLLSEVADFFQLRRRKTVPAPPPAGLVRLLLDANSYEPFTPLSGSWPSLIEGGPVVFHDDRPLVWVDPGDGAVEVELLRRQRLRAANITLAESPSELDPDPLGGFVYFIGRADGEGLVKIGYSDDPQGRLGQLQTGSPVELALIDTVPGSLEREAELHAELAASRRHGEWFERHAALALLARLRGGA
jgi:hypothetical protein